MRRPRRLTVDTFPFLAVLLGAMGSLILVLLIFDYRSKQAARIRVETETAQRVEEVRRATEARREELQAQEDTKRREWEDRREALRRESEARRAALAEQIQQASAEIEKHRRQDVAERQALTAAQQQATEEQARIEAFRQKQSQQTSQSQQTQSASRQAEQALAQLSKELDQLEQTVRDLRQDQGRDPNTYSVVPYRGKQGSNRRPIYIECTSAGLIYHPEKTSRPAPFTPPLIRAELEQRIEKHREKLPEEQRNLPPYLLLLVRPDGIENYYDLQAALKGLPVVFGYEFLDRDWALVFPDDPPSGSPENEESDRLAGGKASRPGEAGGGQGAGRAPPRASEEPRGGGLPLPELGAAPPDRITRLPPRPEGGPPPSPGTAAVPGPQPEPQRRPARITAPRDWLIYVECRADSAVLHPRNVSLPLNMIETPAPTNPLRTLVSEILQKEPAPLPGKAPVKLRVRFVVHPEGGERSFHAVYPALLGLPIDMDVVRLRPGDEVRAVLLGQ